MLLDIRFLVEQLTSSAWGWTVEGCERLLAHLGLREAEGSPGLRQFRAPSGLLAALHAGADGTATRLEFPFELPDAVRANPEHFAQFVDLVAGPLKAILGEPTPSGFQAEGSPSWVLPAATLTVESSGGDTVSLVVSRPG